MYLNRKHGEEIEKEEMTHVDTWAGKAGFGSKLFQEHCLLGINYGVTHIVADFPDRSVEDEWFQDKFNQRAAAKDMEATGECRYDPKFNTGGIAFQKWLDITKGQI